MDSLLRFELDQWTKDSAAHEDAGRTVAESRALLSAALAKLPQSSLCIVEYLKSAKEEEPLEEIRARFLQDRHAEIRSTIGTGRLVDTIEAYESALSAARNCIRALDELSATAATMSKWNARLKEESSKSFGLKLGLIFGFGIAVALGIILEIIKSAID